MCVYTHAYARTHAHKRVSLRLQVNPEATNPVYQEENLNFFGFTLNTTEMAMMNSTGAWLATASM
jgi:diketogulonate reductase-like aldo/keto reductase